MWALTTWVFWRRPISFTRANIYSDTTSELQHREDLWSFSKKLSGSGKSGGSEILDWWDYRRNRISFNFVCSFLSARGSRPSSRWLPGTNLLTSVHSRGKWHQRACLLCHITNYFIHSQIYADGTIEQPFLTHNWVLSLSVITVK